MGGKESITFYAGSEVVFEAKLRERLNVIQFLPVMAQLNAATLEEWHARFSHISKDTIQQMQRNKVVDGLTIVSTSQERCEPCELNEIIRVHHQKQVQNPRLQVQCYISTQPAHNLTSLGGSKYIIPCKDEATKYRQVAFTIDKTSIKAKVKQFVSRATLETNNQVLKLVTDNGSEFLNDDLKGFLQGNVFEVILDFAIFSALF